MKNKLKVLLVLFTAIGGLSFTVINDLPEHWFVAGNQPNSYIMKMDNTRSVTGKHSALIASIDKKIKGFGTLMQTSSAKEYRGKKVKMKGMIKTEDIKKWGGFWLRIDGEGKQVLGFDNMKNRKIKGTTDWTAYEIILDVPEHAKTLNFGALLVGTGKLWFDDLSFEVLSVRKKEKLKEYVVDTPMNLGFEK